MDAYQKYLDEVMDSTYNELKPLTDKLKNNVTCPHCGASCTNVECKYCGFEFTDLNGIFESVGNILSRFSEKTSNLPISDLKINKLFNLLYSLKEKKIPAVNDLLKKYDYPDKYINFLYQTLSKLSFFDTLLSDLEINTIETQIYINDQNSDLSKIYDFFIRNALSKKQNISYEYFKEMLKQFVLQLMKNYYPTPKCVIKKSTDLKEDKQDTIASGFVDMIWLAEEDIRKLYENGNPLIIYNIFHELAHTAQYSSGIYGKNISPLIIDEIKEHVLQRETDWYYDENYEFISFELEAEYYGNISAMEYLNNLGFMVNKEARSEELEKMKLKMRDKKRFKNGQETSIDIEFDKVIYNRPELLQRHPQLYYLYKIYDGVVIPKNEEELLEDYQMIMKDPGIDQTSKDFYDDFYSNYLHLNRNIS